MFRREQVVEEVALWERQLAALYSTVRNWLAERPELSIDLSRHVTMSEELMQKYAVADRELPVMDIMRGEEVAVSLIPRGLWLVGARGRVDLITKDLTLPVLQIRDKQGVYSWCYFESGNRRELLPFAKEVLLRMLGGK